MPGRKALNRLFSGKRLLLCQDRREFAPCPMYIRLKEMAFQTFCLYFCGFAAQCPGLPTRRHCK